MNIVLKPRALKNLAAIERYLQNEFGSKVKGKFVLRLREALYLLSKNPYLGKVYGSVRRYVVSKEISIIYEVEEKTLVILFFWDNRRKPLW